MHIDLTGKTALVSGSTRGIGRAIAKSLSEAGAAVIVHGRDQTKAQQVADEIGNGAKAVSGDLSTADGTKDVLDQVHALGTVDILINNAGIFEPKPFLEIPDEDWTRFFEVNVMSAVRLTRALLPAMLDKNWGRVIFISSESALNIPEEMVHYGMTKTALLSVSRGVAQLTRNTGVTVNAVLPGPTRSEGVVEFIGKLAGEAGLSSREMEAEFIKQHRPTSLIWRFADLDEVANMVTYAVSPQASASNGAALRVDGGVVNQIG